MYNFKQIYEAKVTSNKIDKHLTRNTTGKRFFPWRFPPSHDSFEYYRECWRICNKMLMYRAWWITDFFSQRNFILVHRINLFFSWIFFRRTFSMRKILSGISMLIKRTSLIPIYSNNVWLKSNVSVDLWYSLTINLCDSLTGTNVTKDVGSFS